VVAVVSRRGRLLFYLAGVAGWVLVATGLNAWANGGSVVNIDVVLTGMLGVMTVLWLARRQEQVDGFEVVLTVVVTSTLWLLPLALNLTPDRLSRWGVLAAVLAPGASAIWAEVKVLRRRTGSATKPSTVALWCLCYGLLASIVWMVGGVNADLADKMSTALLSYLLLPLAMLVIVATSAGRARLAPPAR
jgi:hypothetical protein